MTEPRRTGTSPQYRAVASGMNLSLDVSHRSDPPLRSPPVHVGGTSSHAMRSCRRRAAGGSRQQPRRVAFGKVLAVECAGDPGSTVAKQAQWS